MLRMNPETIFTEDSPEIERAARALADYYDGDQEDWDNWIAGAVVALNAAFPVGVPDGSG